MYVENVDGFAGQGDILSKFGIENRDEATLIVAKRTWQNALYGTSLDEPRRPKEGDLLYFTLSKSLFEIRFVEQEEPFYQLQNLPVYKLTVEAFEYSDEAIDTGIDEVDVVEILKDFKLVSTDDGLVVKNPPVVFMSNWNTNLVVDPDADTVKDD